MIRLLCRHAQEEGMQSIGMHQLQSVLSDPNSVTWLDLTLSSDGISEAANLLSTFFEFHPLAIEDALVETHLSRVDDWQKYLYVSFHSLEFNNNSIRQHELDIFLGSNYLVTIHFDSIVPLNRLWEAFEKGNNQRASKTADRLLYHLFDKIATTSMAVVEMLDDSLDELEHQIFTKPRRDQLAELFRIRRTVLQMRRIFGSQRETMNRLARDPMGVVHPDNRVYFRDIYDHLMRMHELSDGLRDMVSGALESHISITSYRMNEVMKTLTIVTVLFMPLTFVTGYFGMNFFGDKFNIDNPFNPAILFVVCMCLTLVIPPAMLWWMAKRGWLRSQLQPDTIEKTGDTNLY